MYFKYGRPGETTQYKGGNKSECRFKTVVNFAESSPIEFQNWPVYKQAVIIAKEAQKFCLTATLANIGRMLSGMIRHLEKSVEPPTR